MSLRNQIVQCKAYERIKLPRYLVYLRDEIKGIRKNLELKLERAKYEFRENLLEKVYAD